jgi:hypothetical protein
MLVSAQTPDNIVFGCGNVRTEFIEQPRLLFEPIAAPDVIREWQSRRALTFTGFDVAQYSFSEVRFYRWHVPVPGREGKEQNVNHDSSQALDLAVQVSSPNGQQWFHLVESKDSHSEGFLFLQPDPGDAATADTPDELEANPKSGTDKHDEMTRWLTIMPATPSPSIPIFLLDYAYNDSGANASGTIRNKLLLNFQKGVPQIAKAAQCIDWEGGGACGAPDTAYAFRDRLNCSWDFAANDFRCSLVSNYGGVFSTFTAQHDFYLLSGETAKPAPDLVPDLALLAQRTRANMKLPSPPQTVYGLGPTTLLAHYTDLLPGSEAFLFASAAAGTKTASHFTVVTLTANGKSTVQPIAKWDLSGEQTDEGDPPADFTPIGVDHQYRVHNLETRPSFRAIEVTLTSAQGDVGPVHVVYWIGLEAAHGALVANAVRLASTGASYGSCNQWLADGTASLIQRKPGIAEATVHVQSQEPPMVAEDEPRACPWAGLLHWKPAAGFRVRKLRDLCDSPTQIVMISEDGAVTSKDVSKEPPQ